MKRWLGFLIISCMLFSACSNKQEVSNDANTLRVDIGMEPPTLDPALAEDAYTFRVVNDLFAGLIDFDQTNKPIAGMAESWEISPDGKTYTFHLHENLKFSDGTPITAKDFVYSWQRLIDPKTACAYSFLLKSIVNAQEILSGKLSSDKLGVEAVDNNTFRVKLDYPNNAFLSYMTVPDVFVVPRHIIQKYGNDWTNPKHMVTSGAYTLKEHVLNGYILAAKNPYYYNASNVKINRIKYFPYVDVNVALANYKTGVLDTTWQNVPIDQYKSLKRQYMSELHTVTWERLEFLNFNMTLPKYANNLKLREALSMAIDRDILVKNVLKSGQRTLYSVVTPTIEAGKYAKIKYEWQSLSREKRLAKARQLYKAAGYSNKNPLKVTLKYKTNDLYRKVAISIAAMWSDELGVDVVLQNEEWKSLIQSLHNANYDISFGGWGADYNSITTYTPIYACNNANNHSHYCNKQYDSLIDQAIRTVDNNKQELLYKQALQLMLNSYSIIPLFQPSHQRLVNSRVQNYHIKDNYLDNVQSKWMTLRNYTSSRFN